MSKFGLPLTVFAVGLAFGLIAAPDAAIEWMTLASYGIAFLTYILAKQLARRGHIKFGAMILILAAIIVAVLAFAPSPTANRKVTFFNAWAFQLGSWLPPLFSPPPHPNGAAAALVVGLGLAGGIALEKPRARFVGACIVLILGTLLFLTASRAGWLAGMIALTFLAASRGWRWAVLVIGLAGIFLIILFVAERPPALGNPSLLSTESLTMRHAQWEQTLTLLRQHPLTGLGLARFPTAYAAAIPLNQKTYKTPNNTLLQLWSDAGVLGLAAWFWIFWRFIQSISKSKTLCHPHRAYVLGLQAGLLAFGIHGLFEANTVIVWFSNSAYHHLASPLPYIVLGLLEGLAFKTTG